mgnify:FL=1
MWVNERAIKQLKLDDDAVGRKCYEVMAGKSAPCANCALKRLKDMPEYSQMEQTIYNPHMDRSFACYDSLFPWVGGRLVHMCYALDITGRESLGMESCMPAPGVGYAHEA